MKRFFQSAFSILFVLTSFFYVSQIQAMITSFDLINGQDNDTIKEHAPIVPESIIYLNRLPTQELTIAARVKEGTSVRSLKFWLNGSLVGTENFAPFVLYGGNLGNYSAKKFSPGRYTLEARAYSGYFATGNVIDTKTLNFTIAETDRQGSSIEIYAAGTSSQGDFPTMELWVNQNKVSTYNSVKGNPGNNDYLQYVYNYNANELVERVDVVFVNDQGTKDLYVDKLLVDGQTYQTESDDVYATGVWDKDRGCHSGYKKTEKLQCNGRFVFTINDQPQESLIVDSSGIFESPEKLIVAPGNGVIEIFAAGTPAEDGVYPTMELKIGGQVVATYYNVNGNASEKIYNRYVYSHAPEGVRLDDISIAFVNDGGGSGGRDLRIDKVVVDNNQFEIEADTTFSTGTFVNGSCQRAYTKSEWLHCDGEFFLSETVPAISDPDEQAGVELITPTKPVTTLQTPVNFTSPSTKSQLNQISVPASQRNTLKGAMATQNIFAGAAINHGPWKEQNQTMLNLVKKEYNLVGMENGFKYQLISKSRTNNDFSDTDAFVDWATANGMVIHVHGPVWFNAVPPWLEKAVNSGQMDGADVEVWLEDFIKTYVSRYRGKVRSWDVVNEIVHYSFTTDVAKIRNDFWLKTIGPDYPEKAMRWAREADPNLKIYVNDYHLYRNNKKMDFYINLIKDWQRKGVPIDGIGFQAHQRTDWDAGYDNIDQAMSRISDLGLEIMVTELDIAIPKPINAAGYQKQAEMYRNTVRACINHQNCKGVITWGITDNYSWVPGIYDDKYDDALPFDRQYKPKSAYNAMIDAVNGR